MSLNSSAVRALLLLLLTASCGCHSQPTSSASKPMENGEADHRIRMTAEQIRLNQIETGPVSEDEVQPTMILLGRVIPRAAGEAQVFSPFAGRLVADPGKIPQIGAQLQKGDLIAEVEQLLNTSEKLQLSSTTFQLQAGLEDSQRQVDFQRLEYARAQALYARGAISLKQLQAAELSLKQAQTQADLAQRTKRQYDQLASMEGNPRREFIRAPINGTVVAADLTPGQLTDPSKSLLTIVDLTSVWVEVSLHESALPLVRKARQADIIAPTYPGRTFSGQLVALGNVVNSANRTLTATFRVDNRDGNLKIGMYAEARVPTGSRQPALTVPAEALLLAENHTRVFVETAPGTFELREIQTGGKNADRVIVASGLKQGEKVVIRGAQPLMGEVSKEQRRAEEN